MEAHDGLHLEPMLLGLLEELNVSLEVVLLWPVPLTYTPPAQAGDDV